jgi:hypothetical protein
MKQLPDILTSAGFWASIATLWGAAGAWGAFVWESHVSREQTKEGVLNLLEGIKAELDLIEGWASGKAGEVGYPRSKTRQQLRAEYPHWFYPTFHVFTFQTPTLSSLTNSEYVRLLGSIVPPLVKLNYSVHRMFDFIERHRTYVLGNPSLFQTMAQKLAESRTDFSAEEEVFRNMVFTMNMQIHQGIIGGMDSPDELCLYRAFRIARDAVRNFNLHVESPPKWYWVLHLIAVSLFLNGLWQILRWFDLLK